MRFVDEAEITARSGKGGDGCVSFRRERFIPRGGPDGGDGGEGGSLYVEADPGLLTLYDFKRKRLFAAQNGRPGMGRQRFGRSGDDLVIYLPVGTQVYSMQEDGESLLADLVHPGQRVLLAQGGRGGKGNTHFKSSTMRAPRFAQPGEEGVELRLKLRLKVLADAGLLGLPNAGKSTLLSRISAARPKIGSYPFTTINPNLGVLRDQRDTQMVVADIPGLISGAHQGRGLGDRFLKHVERTRFLVHILSVEDIDLDSPWQGFEILNQELEKYSPELASREQVLVLNKTDLLSRDELDKLGRAVEAYEYRVYLISALEGTGVEKLVQDMWERFYRLSVDVK
ncbi:GTP-binding protein Obg/CgtA [Desulfonatronospira thiodismutans ASO3-1]|uniref:GTPase Obg n=1 Tax=Desulfonatronospira thiodismutans ASO3-1 TaxID=555779 RepID=D6SMQ9_9BACT|nr:MULTISPECIES: GTPase ObgE [Desulfonatronospira]EFI35970.1 GTP-binding protein Obg/CgtA [Desulfonatronospira thiodismutans ASO3-1]RQD78376.1 MAG: GTPase ObgE [Desulfonatronospira sp. MSAO_Bac3]